jgi:ribosomal protein S30
VIHGLWLSAAAAAAEETGFCARKKTHGYEYLTQDQVGKTSQNTSRFQAKHTNKYTHRRRDRGSMTNDKLQIMLHYLNRSIKSTSTKSIVR